MSDENAEQLAKALAEHTKALWANTAAMRDLQRAVQNMPHTVKMRY